MTMYDIPLTTIEAVERKISKQLRKWMGLPPSLSKIGLYCRTSRLQLPLTSVVEEYKVCKARAAMSLEGSRDERVSQAGIEMRTGRKWAVGKSVEEARSNLRHREIVGVVAQGRLGLGASRTVNQRWCTAGPRERREMVQSEIIRKEEEYRRAQAVSQGYQGAWTRWEGIKDRRVMWNELYRWKPLRTQFLIKAVYDLLPTPANKKRWGVEEEENCGLCGKRGTLSHILSGCPVALSQGRYRWRHDKVLRVLAVALEEESVKKRQRSRKGPQFIGFVKEGEAKNGPKRKIEEGGIFATATDWAMQVDLDSKLVFQEEIVATRLRPDVVLWSKHTKQVILIELTVPWEERPEEAYERKALKYQELLHMCKERGWKASCYPVEIGTRGFICQSMWRALGVTGVKGKRRREVTKKLAEEAEKASRWLWFRSGDKQWKNLG
ncbi:uncharacterized protein [Branchiostoma lanceolatum]|uniref:uncharacterized protein n=1 Tax=Branchiostoma lanceolatum TaxID=7740 RepID=UPI0034569D4F